MVWLSVGSINRTTSIDELASESIKCSTPAQTLCTQIKLLSSANSSIFGLATMANSIPALSLDLSSENDTTFSFGKR